MILKGAKVFLIENKGFIKKDIEINNGKIINIDNELNGTDVINAEGKYITPGLIDAHSHIGMWEECIGEEGADGNEMTDAITPHLRGIDGINPCDPAFKDALQGGVTTAASGPGSTNVLGGQFAVIKLYGNAVDDMIIKQPVAMKCAFGENPKRYYGKDGKAPMTRMNIAGLLRKTLNEAVDYFNRKEAAKSNILNMPAYNEKFESLKDVLDGSIPLKAHAHRADDILTAIRIAKEFNVNMTLEHCTEGHLIIDKIKESGFCAIVGPSFGTRSKVELENKSFNTPKELIGAGIKTAIMTDHPVNPQSSLIMWAALSVKAGLSEYEAIKAVTSNPAEILGVDNCIGRIKEGLDADVVIWDRHPLDIQAHVLKTFVNGKIVYEK